MPQSAVVMNVAPASHDGWLSKYRANGDRLINTAPRATLAQAPSVVRLADALNKTPPPTAK